MHRTLSEGRIILFSNALNATRVLIVEPGGYRPDKALFVRGFFSFLIKTAMLFSQIGKSRKCVTKQKELSKIFLSVIYIVALDKTRS